MKRALVLGGGGSKGAYHCGVWKSLKENRQKFDVVIGSSIGALTGAMYLGNRYKELYQLWHDINVDKVLNNGVNFEFDYDMMMSQKDRFLPMLKAAIKEKGMDAAPLYQIVTDNCDVKKIKKSKMDFFVITVEIPNLLPYQINIKEQEDDLIPEFLKASSACFPALPIVTIKDKKYVDGGYFDNLPINTAIEQKAEEIIAVNLKAPGIIRKPRPNDKRITVIEPYWNLGSMLNFTAEVARRNMVLGYLDGQKSFGKLFGYAYTFRKKAKILDKLAESLAIDIGNVNHEKAEKFLPHLQLKLSSADEELLSFNNKSPKPADYVLRLLEKIMELSDYEPTEVYEVKTVIKEIKEMMNGIEKVDVKKGVKKLASNPKKTLQQFELKKLLFSLAYELETLDCNVICLLYQLFPSECLAGLLINSILKMK